MASPQNMARGVGRRNATEPPRSQRTAKKRKDGAQAVAANVSNLDPVTSPPPTLLPLALQSVSDSTLILPQSSEKQEQQEKEETKAKAAWQGKGEDVSQLEVKVEGRHKGCIFLFSTLFGIDGFGVDLDRDVVNPILITDSKLNST